jgi:hypothetical protein
MITPWTPLLNIKTSAQLKFLRTEWQGIVAKSFGADKQDAQKYLDEILAELRQRGAQSTALTIASAPAEFLGFSPLTAGGAGSVVGGAADTIGSAAAGVGSGIKTTAIYIGGALFVLAAAYIYLATKKGK